MRSYCTMLTHQLPGNKPSAIRQTALPTAAIHAQLLNIPNGVKHAHFFTSVTRRMTPALCTRTFSWQDPTGAQAARTMSGLDYLNAMGWGEFAYPPLM